MSKYKPQQKIINDSNNNDQEDISFVDYCKVQAISPIDNTNLVISKKIINSKTKIVKLTEEYQTIDLSDFLAPENYCQNGQQGLIKELSSEKITIIRYLDLHQLTQSQAFAQLEKFINQCLDHKITTIKIIHGKGFNSPSGISVLKNLVRKLLLQNHYVLGYTAAHHINGGSGATIARLKLKKT